jgi:hypothetical protein
MWLDRLSGHSTPAQSPPPRDRSHLSSLLVRRSTSLTSPQAPQRPVISDHPSELSLVSNDSSASLLSDSWKPTKSALRQSTTSSDPLASLEVLEKLLGHQKSSPADINSADDDDESDGVDETLVFGGIGLYDLAKSGSIAKNASAFNAPQSVEECQ